MKLALLVALATVAAVSSFRPSGHSVVYKPGEQYVYHYRAQILNGIPKSSKQFSGLLLDSLVLLQFQQDNRVVMKFENIKLYKIDNKVSTEPSESITESETTRLTGTQEQIIVTKLGLPIKFRYEEGEIREVQNENRDKYWSINIKKGCLSMFQVTLKEKHSLSSDSSLYYDPTMSRIKFYGQRSSYGSSSSPWNPTTKTNSVYTVKETDVTGFCETKYTIITDKTHHSSSSSVMHVTAVRNFESCTTKPFNIEGLFQGVPTNSAEKELIHPTVHTDYVITGDRSHFKIQEATRRGKYFVYVNGLQGADLSTYVNQKLTLKNTESIRNPVHLVSPKVDHRGLQMIIPKANLLPEKEGYDRESSRSDSFLYKKKVEQEYELNKAYEAEDFYQEESAGEDVNDILPVVEQKLKQLVQCIYTQNSEKKCSDLVMEVTLILREAKKEELKTIYSRYVKQSSSHQDTEQRISEILLDILPTLTTPDAATVLVQLIREGHVTSLRGSFLINSMCIIIRPTPSVIKQLLELFKELPKETTATTLSTKALLRQSTMLGVGTLVHRLLVTMKSQGKPVHELVTFLDTVSMEMKRHLEDAGSDPEKILILKSMGNMGTSENIMTLKKWCEDRRESKKVRINAIFALRRLAKDFKKQVIPILMGVFMDMKEEREIRQAAFLVIIRSDPTYTTLQMIAHRVNYDKSAQIRTLVYTNLVNLAFYTSHQPEHKTLMKNARLVLKTINPVHVGFYDSMSVFVNKFSDKYDMGAALDVTKIKSKMSGIPEAIIANLQATVFGKHRTIVTAGAEGKAVEILLRKVFGPHGALSQLIKGKVSLEDVLKPIVSSAVGGVDLKVLDIMNKMRMERPIEHDLFATWFVQVLGNEMQYITLNSHNMREFKNKVMNMIPELMTKLARGMEFDVVKTGTHQSSLTVATSMGIPLHLNHSIYGVFKMEGSAKISNLPTDLTSLWHQYKRFSLPQSWQQFKQFPFSVPELNFDLKVRPFVDVSQYITISSDLRWLTAGAGTENYLRIAKPFRLTAEVNKPQHSVSLKYFPTKETTPVFHLRGVPFLFINYIPTTTNRLPYTQEVKEIKNEEIVKTKPFNFQFDCRLTGQMFQAQGSYSLCGPKWCPIMPLFGKQEIVIVARQTTDVEFVELKLQSVRNNFEYEGIPSHQPTQELYEEFEEEYDVDEKESANYRTASRSSRSSRRSGSGELTDEFEPVNTDPIFQGETPIKRQVRLTLRPSNRQVEAFKSQLTWLMSRNCFINQFNAQMIRSASNGMPNWKIMKNTVVNPLAWYPEEAYRGARGEYLAKTTVWVNINGEQKEFKLKVVPGSPFNFAEEMRQHKMWPIEDESETRTKTYKYTVEVEFPQVNHRTMKALMWIDNTFKYMFYDRLTTDIPRDTTENKLIASVELLPEWEKMHIIVKNPRENMYISNVPFYWNPFLPTNEKIKLHNHYAWNFYKQSQSEEDSLDIDRPYRYTPLLAKGQCKVDFVKKFVSTFDGVKYSIRPTLQKVHQEGCGLLTAQDCSKQGLFSLYVKGRSEEAWGVKLHLPNADIEIKVAEKRVSKVEVNGEVISLRQQQIYSVPSVESVSVEHEIELISEEEVIVRAKELGLVVRINQREFTADVHISHGSMLWGNICGLCGNNNQDPSDDLEIPRNLKVPSSRPFYLSHLIPSDTCNLDSPAVSSDYCKKTTHITIRRNDNEVPMKCTSERKIVQCSEGCKPTQVRSVKTCFRCQGESEQSLVRRSYYQASSLVELEDQSLECEEFSERMEVPTTCEPIY